MITKQEVLTALQEGIESGVVTEADIQPFITTQPAPVLAQAEQKTDKLSAVDVMFYISGIVLYATILSAIAQSWDDGDTFVHILSSAGIGSILWGVAYYLVKSPMQSDIRNGLINALLLTGSLSITTGGYIILNELIGSFDEVDFMPAALAFVVVGALHIGFDRLVKRDLTLTMGTLLLVAAFPAFLFGLIKDMPDMFDVRCMIMIAAAGLLAYATRVIARINPDRPKIRTSFDSFAALVGLGSMYVASFGDDYGVLWFVMLFVAVFGIFYLSIISQNKHLLGSASAFLVLAVITVAFRYFSGGGITMSLIVATLGLLGSAAVATSINKKYFKS